MGAGGQGSLLLLLLICRKKKEKRRERETQRIHSLMQRKSQELVQLPLSPLPPPSSPCSRPTAGNAHAPRRRWLRADGRRWPDGGGRGGRRPASCQEPGGVRPLRAVPLRGGLPGKRGGGVRRPWRPSGAARNGRPCLRRGSLPASHECLPDLTALRQPLEGSCWRQVRGHSPAAGPGALRSCQGLSGDGAKPGVGQTPPLISARPASFAAARPSPGTPPFRLR